jgi:hypothetical protein
MGNHVARMYVRQESTRLGYAAGLRIRGNGRFHDCIAPLHAAGGSSILKRTSSVKPIQPTHKFCIRKSGVSSNTTSVQFTEEGRS